MEQPYDISPEEFEQIEQFLNNELSADASAAFAERLRSDELLQQKLNEVKYLQLGIREAELQGRLNTYHEQIGENRQESKKNGRIIPFGRALLVAASIVTIVGLSVWWYMVKETGYEKLYSAYYAPDPGLITAMGATTDYTFEKAMVDYKNGQYDKALTAWNSLLAARPNSDTLRYFVAVTYQAKGDNDKAIPELEKAANDSNHTFHKDACWYLGLAYVKQGQTARAIPYLQKSGHPKSDELIKALDKQ